MIQRKHSDQSGFITMIVIILTVLISAIVFVYLRVVNASTP